MKIKVDQFVRVIPQLTITKKVSLIAEESKAGFKKGQLVAQISGREALTKLVRPFTCKVLDGKEGIKATPYTIEMKRKDDERASKTKI